MSRAQDEAGLTTAGRSATDRTGTETVLVHGKDVRVDRVASEVPLAEARSRFGGVDLPAVLGGVLAAVGTTVLLSGLLAGAGRVGYTATGASGDDAEALSVAGLVGGLLALTLALLLGGYVAGRMARYDGLRNGLLTGVGFVLLTALLGALGTALGDRYDVARDVQLPTWFDRDTATAAALLTALLGLALVLGASAFGGRLGARWHQGPDDALVGTRAGALTPYPQDGAR